MANYPQDRNRGAGGETGGENGGKGEGVARDVSMEGGKAQKQLHREEKKRNGFSNELQTHLFVISGTADSMLQLSTLYFLACSAVISP